MENISNKTFIITGASGMLGTAFQEALMTDVAKARVLALSHNECDVTDKNALLKLETEKPDFIIHCAAQTNADECENNPEQCARTQIEGTINVAELAKQVSAQVIYPQSFLIFDGKESPITELTKPNPLSVYARCKLRAEILLKETLPQSLVIRMGGMFGGDDLDKNFVGKFTRHLINIIKEGVDYYEVGDRIWQPTYTLDLARNTLELLNQDKRGIYNMACHGEASFFALAQACVEYLGLSDRISIKKVSNQSISSKIDTALRPERVVLINNRLQSEGLDRQRPWEVALKEYLARPYFQQLIKTLE